MSAIPEQFLKGLSVSQALAVRAAQSLSKFFFHGTPAKLRLNCIAYGVNVRA
jgi:hypothetical protein